MIAISRWFDRQFDFTFPPEQHPNLCVRLRGTPARVEEMIRGCAYEILVHKPLEKWSAQEHAGHLLDLEPPMDATRRGLSRRRNRTHLRRS